MAKKIKNNIIEVLSNYYSLLDSKARYVLMRGSTRCLAPGTLIRMGDGTLKKIEDIQMGDTIYTLNGPDKVVNTHNGNCEMYRITQGKGEPYIVTEDHLLSLKQTRKNHHKENCKIIYDDNYDKDNIHDFTAKEFSEFSENKRKKYSGFKNNFLELPKQENIIDPYYLGLWLGDGTSRQPYAITTNDEEIIDYLKDFCPDECYIEFDGKYTYKMRHNIFNHQSELSKNFFSENLVGNKHIPHSYIYTNYEDRLKLLAGLVDSDGYLTNRNTFEITQKRKNIIEEVIEILHISGFHTRGIRSKISSMKREDGTIYKCRTYSVEFNHPDFNDLNKYIKIIRKRVTKKIDSRGKNYMYTTKIKSELIGDGKYYGFMLENCPYFMLADGTVTHNSGKTIAIIQYLLTLIINESKPIQIVVGVETLQQAKKNLLIDLEYWIQKFGLTKSFKINKSDFIYEYANGSKIIIVAADKPSKWFGLTADIFWFNEATHIDYAIFEQAQMRLPDREDFHNKIILDFNPTNPYSWCRDLENSTPPGGVETYVSTYLDNPFLGKSQVKTIESFKKNNYNKWLVYGKGEYGEVEGAIITNWGTVDEFPKDIPYWVGLDFGFSNDPTAILRVGKQNGELYVEELCYDKGMTNQDIALLIKTLGIDRAEIIADSAEPKSIAEIKKERVNIQPAKKGPDSIKNGIDILQRYRINIVKNSKNLIDEVVNYTWKKNRGRGGFINEPVDDWNHLLDALRYVALIKLTTTSKTKTKTYSI